MSDAASRRPAGPVRQHSLQQPPRRQQQQIIRRQRSTEDNKLQLYANESIIRFNENKCDFFNNHSSKLDRPKVRVAWSENLTKSKTDSDVEIVARQIQKGKPNRPTTGRANRNRYTNGEKATILYSRQELAERLRLAWRQREENKANIDIFLAHNTVEERCDSRISTATSRTNFSTPRPQQQQQQQQQQQRQQEQQLQQLHKKKTTEFATIDDSSKTIDIKKRETDDTIKHKLENDIKKIQKPIIRKVSSWFPPRESTGALSKDCGAITENINKPPEQIEVNEEKKEDEKKEETVPEKKSSLNIDCTNWNSSITFNESKTDINLSIENKQVSKPDYSSAKAKRAGFQSGTNKAFVGPIIEKSSTPRISSRSSSFQDIPRFRRTNSAPPQRKTQVNIIIDASSISTETINPTDTEQITPTTATFKNSNCRSIKSAPPVKRRTKTSRRRSSKDDSDDAKIKGVKGNKNTQVKSSLEAKGQHPDVVTMVSLVSSADSESEMDDNSPRNDKLICELRNKLPTTPIIKSSNGLYPGIRKPFKSVSFQQDSFDYDSPRSAPHFQPDDSQRTSLQARFAALTRAYKQPEMSPPLAASATMTLNAWRLEAMTPTAIATTTIMTSAMMQNEPEAIPPPTDREKRCLAVPIGEFHDKKRKLFRCKSATAAPRLSDSEKQSLDSGSNSELHLKMPNVLETSEVLQKTPLKVTMNSSLKTTEQDAHLPPEPYCQTPKEKECWHLYRRMCDKGVFVSFDTVLRGMLTPTEYRLRQKELIQNC